MLHQQCATRLYILCIRNESLFHFSRRSVYIQVIRIDRSKHSQIRTQLQKAAIILIGLYHCSIIFTAPVVAFIVHRYTTQKSITSITGLPQQVGYCSRDGGLAMCTRHGYCIHRLGDPLQRVTTFVNRIIVIPVPIQF